MSVAAAKPVEDPAAFVRSLFEAKGDAGVQPVLQKEIQKTKKVESDIAVSKKRTNAADRDIEKLESELKQLEAFIANAQHQAKITLTRIDGAREDVAVNADEYKNKREEIFNKTSGEVDTIRAKADDEEAEAIKMEEENAELQKKFDELRAESESRWEGYQKEAVEADSEAKVIDEQLQKARIETLTLQVKEKQLRQGIAAADERTRTLAQQLELYSTQSGDFESAAEKMIELKNSSGSWKVQYEEKLAEVDEVKKSSTKEKVEVDKMTQKLRQLAAQLKKRIQQADKAKTTAESKCRAAQKAAAAEKENASSSAKK